MNRKTRLLAGILILAVSPAVYAAQAGPNARQELNDQAKAAGLDAQASAGAPTAENVPADAAVKAAPVADLGGYHFAALGQKQFRYNVWDCDTQDYFFTFPTEQLAKAADSKETGRKITGRVRIETRGIVDFEGDIACTASY